MTSPAPRGDQDGSGLRIARVEPLTLTRAVRGPFDYRLREDQHGVEVGTLLQIPFGRRNTLGVVTELAADSDLEPSRLVEPHALLDGGLTAELVALADWMASEYCSTPARALALMLAPGAARGTRTRRVLVAELTEDGARAVTGAVPLTAGQRRALERLRRDGPTVAAELGTPALRRLEARGLVSLESRPQRRGVTQPRVGASSPTAPSLTADQEAVLAEILAALGGRREDGLPQPPGTPPAEGILLHGVTGSGKTEVYLQAVQATLEAGRDAIVLVPEIGLTPQTVRRFVARLGPLVAVLHSALGQGERYDEWMALRAGEARVCVGPRSAVFAPLRDVGLIVIDEEHDSSYKHEGDPRYDARTVARRRAEQHGALVLCGTATPRPESVVGMRRLRLARRVDGRPLPRVDVLDMRGRHHPLHPRTRMALADVRHGGQKAIVLLNRRGWSNFLSCRACGRVWICPNCDVALVLHRSGGFVACHHCGHREPVPAHCGACGSAAVARHGAGTERLEHDLRTSLGDPDFPIFRLDADSSGAKDRAGSTLAAFEAARAGLLVGTQMVAKGHDFPDVTLGVVLDADQTLRFPDFRAEERTFALITQLAGRAGRGDAGGRVLVQTLAPEAPSILHAAQHDADGFLGRELIRRRALGYPPFGSLIRIVCAAGDAGEALAVATAFRDHLTSEGVAALGPAPLFRLRGRERCQLLVKGPERARAIAAAGAAAQALAASAARRKVAVSVDVDPQ
jgi:primosomal protein N' (replication factor Y) (superfamily II helicase)